MTPKEERASEYLDPETGHLMDTPPSSEAVGGKPFVKVDPQDFKDVSYDFKGDTPEPQQTWSERFDEEFPLQVYVLRDRMHEHGFETDCTDENCTVKDTDTLQRLKSFIAKELAAARAKELARIEKIVEGMKHDLLNRLKAPSETEEGYNQALTDILAAIKSK